jgi:hypothetical protein
MVRRGGEHRCQARGSGEHAASMMWPTCSCGPAAAAATAALPLDCRDSVAALLPRTTVAIAPSATSARSMVMSSRESSAAAWYLPCATNGCLIEAPWLVNGGHGASLRQQKSSAAAW